LSNALQRGRPEDCSGEAGRVVPVIDRNRCEAKEACVQVCPFDVFEIRSLEASDRAALSLVGKLKAWVHGNRQAYVVHAEDCHACGLCLKACPEQAIRLEPVSGR
jgi:4Fe-4S ferredoxin